MKFDISMDFVESCKIKNNGNGSYTIKIIPLVDKEKITINIKLDGRMMYNSFSPFEPIYLEGSYTVDIMGNIVSIVPDVEYGWKSTGSLLPEIHNTNLESVVSCIINTYLSIYKNKDGVWYFKPHPIFIFSIHHRNSLHLLASSMPMNVHRHHRYLL